MYLQKNARIHSMVFPNSMWQQEKVLLFRGIVFQYIREHICKLAEENDQICAITAAMQTGTALNEFGIRFPKRFLMWVLQRTRRLFCRWSGSRRFFACIWQFILHFAARV